MEEASNTRTRARGQSVLVLFLSLTLGLATYSALSNLTNSFALLHPGSVVAPQLGGVIASVSQTVPASAGFSYYAPQVSSEFRMRMRLGNSKTGQVSEVVLKIGAEAGALVSSLTNMTQEKEPAQAIAASYASFGFTQDREADSVQIILEAEDIPPLAEAAARKNKWSPVATYYFKR